MKLFRIARGLIEGSRTELFKKIEWKVGISGTAHLGRYTAVENLK